MTLFINVQSLPSFPTHQNSMRVKREGPDLVAIGMQAAATAMEMAQAGGGIKNNFNVQHGNEFSRFKLNANKFIKVNF